MIKMNSVENKSDLLSSEFADSELSSGDFQSPSPSYDSAIETQDMSLFSQDQFEGIFYRTQISESKITISFVSKVFFDIFKNKIHSDFIQSVDIDETSFISKCSTHVKGAKCELRLDSHFRTVELLGLGYKVWRAERFPRIAQTLFKRLMDQIDSRMEGESTGVSMSEDLSKPAGPQHDMTTEIDIKSESDYVSTQGPFVSVGNEAESQNLVRNLNIAMSDPIPTAIQKEFTAEVLPCAPVSSQYADVVLPQENQERPDVESMSTDLRYINNERPQFESQSTADEITTDKTVSNRDKVMLPSYTSTPILQRIGGTAITGSVLSSDSVYNIIHRIDQLDSSIKAMKRDIILTMERELNELKVSIVNMIESTGSVRNFSDVVKGTPQVNMAQQLQTVSDVSTIDEGYGNNSGNFTDRSMTQPKTLFIPDSQDRDRRTSTSTMPQHVHVPNIQTKPVSAGPSVDHRLGSISTPQPVPVHITNRNMKNGQGADSRRQSFVPHRNGFERTEPNRNVASTTSNMQKRTLVVGDSLFKEINARGLKNGVRICSTRGAMIKHIWDEIAVFDLKSFANVILCIGGNDASKTDAVTFEQKYDELIGYIKAANSECTIYLCNVVPRGDVDVTAINASIERVAGLWRLHQVKSIKATNEYFFGSNGLPAGRFFSRDGIHLSNSGTKRLVDAISINVDIVHDFQLCIFQNRRYQQKRNYDQEQFVHNARSYHPGGNNRRPQFNGRWNNQKLCYACSMPGHVIADCWFAQ